MDAVSNELLTLEENLLLFNQALTEIKNQVKLFGRPADTPVFRSQLRDKQLAVAQLQRHLGTRLARKLTQLDPDQELKIAKLRRDHRTLTQLWESVERSVSEAAARFPQTEDRRDQRKGEGEFCDDPIFCREREAIEGIARSLQQEEEANRCREIHELGHEVVAAAELFRESDRLVREQGERLEVAMETVEDAKAEVLQANSELRKAVRLKRAAAVASGGLLGAIVGGPVGMFAGAKGAALIVGCAAASGTAGAGIAYGVNKLCDKISGVHAIEEKKQF
eukprot:TRINITY_DN8228_c0_g1_i1.p1 TRINITY_DN8228_c0_g1~~TRINITY_DN8228_c0_g1_i1.p1  ORF type:complete len:289 (-),score=49.51 TRINITY_DN8228_c0_g1_i1:416-1252(-)